MPVHIENMTTEVTAYEGELPLSAEQLDTLVNIVIARIHQYEQEQELLNDATVIRPCAVSD